MPSRHIYTRRSMVGRNRGAIAVARRCHGSGARRRATRGCVGGGACVGDSNDLTKTNQNLVQYKSTVVLSVGLGPNLRDKFLERGFCFRNLNLNPKFSGKKTEIPICFPLPKPEILKKKHRTGKTFTLTVQVKICFSERVFLLHNQKNSGTQSKTPNAQI